MEKIVAGLFFAVCFVFFQWISPSTVFVKEQVPDFTFTVQSFLSYFLKPASLVCYLGDAGMKIASSIPGGAALLLTSVLFWEWRLLTGLMRQFKMGEMSFFYALFPVFLEWGYYGYENYRISSILSFMLVLIIFRIYAKVKDNEVSRWAGFLALPVIYILAGSRMFIFFTLLLLYEAGKNERRWFYWSALLVVSTILPQLFASLYKITEEQAYQYPYQAFYAFFPGMLFCFSLLLLQIKTFRKMRINVVSVSVTTVLLFSLLAVTIYSQLGF